MNAARPSPPTALGKEGAPAIPPPEGVRRIDFATAKGPGPHRRLGPESGRDSHISRLVDIDRIQGCGAPCPGGANVGQRHRLVPSAPGRRTILRPPKSTTSPTPLPGR
ncbi:MAG: hypothetical protein RMK65_10325 [Anaerolineae bacterium]|nr:hypothetical protein [Anaerolineae bacterium]